jgi:hypothetical protein
LAEVRLRTQLVGNNNKRDAIRSAFRHVYWLAKHRVPNRLFPDLREFSILEGNNSFRSLTKKNVRYLSSTFFTDALTAIGNVLRADIIANIRKSQFFSIALDETGDISVTEQLVLYVRSVDPVSGAIRVQLFDLIPLKKADGASIYKATMKSLRDAKLELKRLTNASTDGAGAVFGKNQGFCARLQQDQPYCTCVHCICHRYGIRTPLLVDLTAFCFSSCSRWGRRRELVRQFYLQADAFRCLLVLPKLSCSNGQVIRENFSH